MSLATRCPACGTVFRVVQDQLRVSEGWVRCGHCQEVFNALESLFELSAEAPLPAPGAGSSTAARAAAAAAAVEKAPAAALPPPPEATELDLSDPGDPDPGASIAEARPAGTIPPDTPPASPPPDPAPLATAPPPTAPAFEAPMSVSGLLARPDAGTPSTAEMPAVTPERSPGEEIQPGLLDADGAPDPLIAQPAGGAVPAEAAPSAPLPFEADDDPRPSLSHDEAIEMPPSRWQAEDETPAQRDASDPPSTPAPLREWQRKRPRQPRAPGGDGGPETTTPTGPGGAPRAQPAFVRQAERDALWQRPAARASLMGAAGVLGLLLLAQAALYFRDGIAARWPGLRPALVQACDTMGCEVGAPHALERISLDGSKLTSGEADGAVAAPGGGKVLRFAAELHNAAQHPVRAPALELSFTDPLGQVVARRVLLPRELGLANGTIAAGSPWHVDARLDVGELRVAGFSVEIFYP
ncbi:MAG TPA: DUF3426 domain-containing protein [Ideonella sp.]|nr:DUF3426 domain-containing protein [Ideonella sp.]